MNTHHGASDAPTHAACRVMAHLRAAQEIADGLEMPHIGARIQEAIDALEDAVPSCAGGHNERTDASFSAKLAS